MQFKTLDDFLDPVGGGLPPAEATLAEAAVAGEAATVSSGKRPDPAADDDKLRVRGAFLRYLALGGCDKLRPHSRGVHLQGAVIDGPINLEAARIDFPIRLISCALTGRLKLRDAELRTLSLRGCELVGGGGSDPVLSADRAHFRGDLVLSRGFRAAGLTSLIGAFVEGDAHFQGGRFEAAKNVAINARRLRVAGDLNLSDGFRAMGSTLLMNARIQGDLRCNRGQFAGRDVVALRLTGAEIDGVLVMRDRPTSQDGKLDMFEGRLILTAARARSIVDHPDCWPKPGDLSIEGFVYQRLGRTTPTDARVRRRWLLRQRTEDLGREFKPQPWEQLERVLTAQGLTIDAKRVGVYKERARRAAGAVPWHLRPLHRLYGMTVGYGYFTSRAIFFSAVLVVLGALMFGAVWRAGAMVPAHEVLLDDEAWTDCAATAPNPSTCWLSRLPGKDYEAFSAALYSLDVFLPIVSLEQEPAWTPSAARGDRLGDSALGQALSDAGLSWPWLAEQRLGGVAWIYRIVHEALGYILSAFAVAGAARLVRES